MEPVVIVGAGPSGLATAACLKRLEIGFALLDRSGTAGGSFRQMPRGMRLLSPRRYVHLPHLLYPGSENYPSMPDYESYLREYATHFGLVPERREILGIKRTGEGFEIHCASAPAMQCRCVLIATGLFGNPVWPEIDGLASRKKNQESSAILHSHDWGDRNAIPGQRILIIGAGISGVSVAEECAKAGAEVMVSRRSTRTRLVPARLLGLDILHWFRPVEFLPRSFFGRLCQHGVHPPAYDNGYRAFVANGKITELPEVKQIEGRKAKFADGSCHEVEIIVAATGYKYETPFLPPEVRRAPGGHPIANECESPDWPGLFFVGAPCARRINSEFLRGIASDAVRVAERIELRLRKRSK